MKKGKVIVAIISVLVIAALAVAAWFFLVNPNKNKATVITESQLKEAVEINDLSTAEFVYNGIAEVYKEKKKDKIDYRVKYNSTVKVGVDLSKISFDIDNENKTVKPILPRIEIQEISVKPDGMSFIPDDAKGDINKVRSVCEDDATKEAKNSKELFEIAKENLKNTVEALLKPLIENDGYTIIWE